MNIEAELVNIYIDKLNAKIAELQRALMLSEANLELSGRIIRKLEEEKNAEQAADSKDDF